MTVESDHASRRQAVAALGEVTRLRTSTRQAWGSPWFALVCFGCVTVIAAVALAALGSGGLVATWLVAGVGTLLLVGRYYRRQGRRVGVTGRGRVAWSWSLAAFGFCFGAAEVGGRASGREAGVAASIVAVVVACAAFGSWQRRADAPVAVAVVAAPALVLAALGIAPWLVELAFGVGLIAAGVILREKAGSA